MDDRFGLKNVAPPPGGLSRLQRRLSRENREPVRLGWIGAAAAALLAVSWVLQPPASELPAWARDHPRLRITDGVKSSLTLKRGSARRLAASSGVTVYLVDVAESRELASTAGPRD
ncbi:MAG: hypothetical protein AAF552_08860 [Pseudomonadota bacterium]